MTAQIDFLGEKLNAYKANLHMHSTTSDGTYSLSELVGFYGNEGYDILTATDHHIANSVSEIDCGDLLLMSGMEFHPIGPRGILLHLIAMNVPEDFKDPSKLPYQKAIECVRDAGGECILAHPYWCGLNCSDIMGIKNIIAIEVYNTSTRYIGKDYNMQVWDNILQLGYHLPAIAVDDTHQPRDFFRGWTMICCKEKTNSAIMDALKKGTFYASQGPEIYKIGFEENIFSIECSPCEEIIVIGDCSFGRCGTVPGFEALTTEDINKTKEMTAFKTEIPESYSYIRCQIRDKYGKYAWSSPIKLAVE